MANPNFDPRYSTDQIWRGTDENRCLSDDLDTIENDIEALEDSKADAEHAHTGYATVDHTHTGYAEADHAHTEYAAAGHTHTEYAAAGHTHTEYAAADHTHSYTAAEVGAAAAEHGHMVYNSDTSVTTYKLVYVGPNGNDDNAGLSTSAPMATIKGVIRKYAEKYKMLDIRLLDGTYTENIGSIATDVTNLSIRSASENKDAVTINMSNQIDLNSCLVRLYNMTLNVTETGIRCISLNSGALYAYNVRFNVPEASTVSCVNVYNGTQAFLMNCVLNAGTGANAGAAIYGNQATLIKAINCTSERTNALGVHAHNGSDIWYTDTITATTKKKETYYGKCTLRS